jgi:hypothetical protein
MREPHYCEHDWENCVACTPALNARIADLEKQLAEYQMREMSDCLGCASLRGQLSEAHATIAAMRAGLFGIMGWLKNTLSVLDLNQLEQWFDRCGEVLSSSAGADFEAKIRADERSKIELTFGFSSHMHGAPPDYQETKMTLDAYVNRAWNEAVEACASRVQYHGENWVADEVRKLKRTLPDKP